MSDAAENAGSAARVCVSNAKSPCVWATAAGSGIGTANACDMPHRHRSPGPEVPVALVLATAAWRWLSWWSALGPGDGI